MSVAASIAEIHIIFILKFEICIRWVGQVLIKDVCVDRWVCCTKNNVGGAGQHTIRAAVMLTILVFTIMPECVCVEIDANHIIQWNPSLPLNCGHLPIFRTLDQVQTSCK